ncbi:TonB-dependent receptor [Sphingomonas bacterium]|uniref:TonB-dependent receptor domain-containing protein n=1 Tax=Sphingomonas bacterium TaxID=1895847 RepID=UPI0020C6244B|nr:TonB-dependent receptor [Sphingomonas bacterium]
MVAVLATVVFATAAPAAPAAHIAIPATTLDVALTTLARQSGQDIISTESALRAVRTRALSGDVPVAAALARLLGGSGYHAVAIDSRSWRIVRDAAVRPSLPSPPPPARRAAAPPPPETPNGDIVVTASKQHIPLLRYPGTLTTISPNGSPDIPSLPDMTDVARATPVLQNTEFGPGRNKIFIRGIADSSFDGATQSTASIYVGDVQLGYAGADPSLKLYDMQGVQVMEGPQGTLYGSGSIGGIVRLLPNPVALDRASGAVSAGGTFTAGGGPGYDVAGMVDLPVIDDRLGFRAVAYDERQGGYIDDPARRLDHTNRIDTLGGRLAVKYDPGGGWMIDATGLIQRIDGADAQYAEAGSGPLSHRSSLPQPFHNQVALGSLSIRKTWASGLELLSATAMTDNHSAEMFDATALSPARGGPGGERPATAYDVDTAKRLLTEEMRLSRSLTTGSSWVIGFTLLSNTDAEQRALGIVGTVPSIDGVTNVTQSGSAFGEGTLAVTRNFAVTLGARLTIARVDGEPDFKTINTNFVKGRSTRRVDPTAGFSWKLTSDLALYGRFQTGYRTGGLAVARGIGRVADFGSDSIRVGEIGVRKLRSGATGLSLTAAVSYARWTDIQADLVNRRGLPYTDNIGNARITAVEGTADWVPIVGLRATAAFLYTQNSVTGPLADLSSPAHRRLPDTPPIAAKIDASYEWSIGRGMTAIIGGSGNYTGRSVIGTGDLFDVDQGKYADFAVRAGLRHGRIETTLSIDNLTNVRGNRFASGNPFALSARDLTTPLQPFNVRLGTAIGF